MPGLPSGAFKPKCPALPLEICARGRELLPAVVQSGGSEGQRQQEKLKHSLMVELLIAAAANLFLLTNNTQRFVSG